MPRPCPSAGTLSDVKRTLTIAVALCACLAPSAFAAGLSVNPTSGPLGTSFTISFAAPSTAAAGFYHVKARAASSRGGSCVPMLNFSNPKAVNAGVRVRFTFRPTGAEELCPGSWAVTVADATGKTLLSGGQFTLGKQGANTPSKPKPQTPTTPSKPTTPSTPTTPSSGISVTPASGGSGTTFKVSFRTPSAAAAGALSVQARAKSARAGSCVSKLNFANPRAVGANVKITFSFTATQAEELCTGPWTVNVVDTSSSQIVLTGGTFSLS